MGIYIHQMLWVIKYNINYGPIRELVSIFTKLLWVIKQTLNYALNHEWASTFAKIL